MQVQDARESGWLQVIGPPIRLWYACLSRNFTRVKQNPIALALEVRPDVLLLDEAEARRVAGLYGLSVTGIIGLLIQAKYEGQVSSLAEEMDRLREEGSFWIQESLYRRVLEMERDG